MRKPPVTLLLLSLATTPLMLSACSGSSATVAPAISPGAGAAGAVSNAGSSTSGNGAALTGGSAGQASATAGAASGAATGAGGAGGNSATKLIDVGFQARTPGPYTMAMVPEDFLGTPSWNNGLDAGRATIVAEAGNNYLQVTYPANKYGPADGGVQFMVPLGKSYEELYLSYRLRFGTGYQFVKGGKLPGLVGGTAPTGCVTDTDGFSARGMWRETGILVQYLYYPEKGNACGDDFVYRIGPDAFAAKPGAWQRVEHHLVMNTAGQHDGVLQAWVDGTLVVDRKDFIYRAVGKAFGIDALYFSTFFGGNDATWAPTADQTVDYDDFVISTGPIAH